MSNKICQPDFIEHTEFTPIVTSIQVKNTRIIKENYDEDWSTTDCCCTCIWIVGMGSFVIALLYYTGVF